VSTRIGKIHTQFVFDPAIQYLNNITILENGGFLTVPKWLLMISNVVEEKIDRIEIGSKITSNDKSKSKLPDFKHDITIEAFMKHHFPGVILNENGCSSTKTNRQQ